MTLFTFLKPEPVRVTVVPTAADVGVMDITAGVTPKTSLEEPVPAAFVTAMTPAPAPAGTVASMEVVDCTVKVAATPLNDTPVTLSKLAPLMLTGVPIGPEEGENEVTAGATVKELAVVYDPACVVTVMRPVVASTGTFAKIVLGEYT